MKIVTGPNKAGFENKTSATLQAKVKNCWVKATLSAGGNLRVKVKVYKSVGSRGFLIHEQRFH